jgi:dihydroxy-acid dehydratase
LRDGDIIVIDADKGMMDVELSAEELAKRKAAWKPRKTVYTSGVLYRYAQNVGTARTGAVTHPGGGDAEGHVYADI